MENKKNNRCNFNHSVNVILFLMFFIVLLAVSFNGCFRSSCKKEQFGKTEETISEPIANETTQQDSIAANQ